MPGGFGGFPTGKGAGGGAALSDATPIVESGSGAAGTDNEASRADHVHPDGGGGGGSIGGGITAGQVAYGDTTADTIAGSSNFTYSGGKLDVNNSADTAIVGAGSGGNDGIDGSSDTGDGVFGASTTGNGVEGQGNVGGYFTGQSSGNVGVYGTTQTNDGIPARFQRHSAGSTGNIVEVLDELGGVLNGFAADGSLISGGGGGGAPSFATLSKWGTD